MFAMDPVPVIFAITTDSFIVCISTIMAILGHRTLDFISDPEAFGDRWC